MIEFAVFGAGRIGTVHAGNLHRHPGAKVRYVVDVDARAAAGLAARCGARIVSATDAWRTGMWLPLSSRHLPIRTPA